MMTDKIRTLRITEDQESVLVEMISFFNDNGWINDDNQTDYDDLADKICDPGFWEYSQRVFLFYCFIMEIYHDQIHS